MSAPSFNQLQEAMRMVRGAASLLPNPVVDLIGQALRHYCDALHPYTPDAGADMFWWADDESGPCKSPSEVVADIAEYDTQTDGVVVEVMRAAYRPPMFVAVRCDPETGRPVCYWSNTLAGAQAAIDGGLIGGSGDPNQRDLGLIPCRSDAAGDASE